MNDEFFGRVAHDLRNELATMSAGVDYLLRYDKQVAPSSRDMLQRVKGASDRLKRLLDELNDAIWLVSDPKRPPLMIAPCHAIELARAAAESLEKFAASRGVRVLVDADAPEGTLAVNGDAELLRKAIEYVVGFAIFRSRDFPVRVIAARQGGEAVVTVLDEAGPVKPEVLECVLEPFGEKAALPDDGVPRRRERLQLGLPIARGILVAHGGSLRVDLVPGDPGSTPPTRGGLRFTCVLGGRAPASEGAGPQP